MPLNRPRPTVLIVLASCLLAACGSRLSAQTRLPPTGEIKPVFAPQPAGVTQQPAGITQQPAGMTQAAGWHPAENPVVRASHQATSGEPSGESIESRLAWLDANQQRLQRLLEQADPLAGPAADYEPDGTPPPDYFFSRQYYERYSPGARPLADYAPPGYEPRDQQQGPAVPEYTRVTPPPQLSTANLERFVTQGPYPGSFLVPGVNTAVRFRGFVRLAALYDFDPIGVPDAFVTNSIPVPQEIGQNFNMSGRISRFSLETWTPTTFRDWNVHTFIEADFFNGPGQAAGGGGNPLRLRHAFLDFGYFRLGQQNSVFMDASSWPSLVDFQGPNSWVNQRQPSARVTLPLWARWYLAASVERPFSDITTQGLGSGVQDVPDFAAHLRYEGNRGHAQVGGLWRTIGYRPTGGQLTREAGGAISGSVVLHPWAVLLGTDPLSDPHPSGLTRSRLLFQASGGSGIGRYLNDLAGQRLDGQVDPLTGQFQLVDARGWNASYEHWLNEHWLANFTYASLSVDSIANQPGSTYDSATYWAASVWWIPVPRLSLAVELLSGERETLDGQSARAQRLHGLAQYNF